MLLNHERAGRCGNQHMQQDRMPVLLDPHLCLRPDDEFAEVADGAQDDHHHSEDDPH